MPFLSVLIVSLIAAVNLGYGIFEILQPDFSPASVAFSFATALFATLMAILVIISTTRR